MGNIANSNAADTAEGYVIPAEIENYLVSIGFEKKGVNHFEALDEMGVSIYQLLAYGKGCYCLHSKNANGSLEYFKHIIFQGYKVKTVNDIKFLLLGTELLHFPQHVL